MPLGYSWKESSDADPDADNLQFQEYGAVNVWGQCFAVDATAVYTARLQARNPRVWFLTEGGWAETTVSPGSMGGAYYTGDFQSGSTGASPQQDGPGIWSAPLAQLDGAPDAYHWWWNGMYPRDPIPPGCLAIIASQEMRLTGPGDFLGSTGADLFATPETVVDPQGWNHGIPNPRMKWITQEWGTFYATTASLATLSTLED